MVHYNTVKVRFKYVLVQLVFYYKSVKYAILISTIFIFLNYQSCLIIFESLSYLEHIVCKQ